MAATSDIDAARHEVWACAADLDAIKPYLDETDAPGVEIVGALWDKLWLRFVAACRRLDKLIDPEPQPPLDAQ